MTSRKGTTLIEVLVAIFVAAIGLLGLLALFPLGALSMNQAIRDSRAAQAAANATAIAETMQLGNDSSVTTYFVAPGGNWGALGLAQPTADQPGFPVYVDPIGANSSSVVPVTAAPGNLLPGIPRVAPSYASTTALSVRWFSLLDDLSFGKDNGFEGLPYNGTSSSTVYRENRYSWAYLLKRPKSTVPSVVDMTVIVYAGRSLQYGGGETAYGNVNFSTTSKSVDVSWSSSLGQEKPNIRAGSWILDATVYGDSKGATLAPSAFFYRVANVTDNGTSLTLELDNYPKANTVDASNNPIGQLVVLDNVVEVFEKGTGWQP
jgi:type II secretory pathway pseudopilin PulG